MVILFDLTSSQPVSESGADFHGGGEYAKTVFYKLCDSLSSGISLEVFYDPHRNIEKAILEVCQEKQFVVHHCVENADISKLLHSKTYNVFYSALPYSYTNLTLPAGTKFVYTVHGLRDLEYPSDKYELKYKRPHIKTTIKHIFFLLFPKWWGANRLKKRSDNYNALFSLTQNQIIITASNHSKYAILYFFPQLNESQIKVSYSPAKQYDPISVEDTDILHTLSLESGKYILIICGDRSEKGAYRACKVLYGLIKSKAIPEDTRIVVLGLSYKKQYVSLTENSRRFEWCGYVSSKELETLYKNAHLFMYPTLNEGFGYPPLEAMRYRTLCACSANSAVTEVCGDAVLYFNPFDETEMGIRVSQSFDNEIRKEKNEKMAVRYEFISKKQENDLNLLIKEIIL